MNEYYTQFLAEDQAETLQDLDVTDAQLNQYLKQSNGLRYAVEDYLEKLAAGFTPEDILLCQELGFWYERHPDYSWQSGHDKLFKWIAERLRRVNRYGATIVLTDFVDVWRRATAATPSPLRQNLILKEYCYARRYTDLSHAEICRLQSEVLAIKTPSSWDRHTLRKSYLRLQRLEWSHEQIVRFLAMVIPSSIKYAVQGVHKGMTYDDVMTILALKADQGLTEIVQLLRVDGVTLGDANDILNLVEQIDTGIDESMHLGFLLRPAGGRHHSSYEAMREYKTIRRSGESHDTAMSAARQAAAECEISASRQK